MKNFGVRDNDDFYICHGKHAMDLPTFKYWPAYRSHVRGLPSPCPPPVYTLSTPCEVLRKPWNDFFENRVVPEESLILSTSELTEIERMVCIVASLKVRWTTFFFLTKTWLQLHPHRIALYMYMYCMYGRGVGLGMGVPQEAPAKLDERRWKTEYSR